MSSEARRPIAAPVITQRAVQTARDDARWIMAFPRGRTEHSKGGWTVDDQFIGWLFEYLGDMREQGYQVPIARQHEQDGYTYGLVADWRATEAGVDLLVEFAGDYAARYDEGLMAHWSPGFYPPSPDGDPVWYDPHTGKGYMVALDELSFVTVPHHTKLDTRGPHYQLAADPGTTTAPPTGGTPMDEEQYMELVGKYDSLVARVDALESSLAEMSDVAEQMSAMNERMTAIEGQPATTEGGDTPAATTQTAAQSPEIVALSREVEGLRRTNAELAVRAKLPDASDEDVKRLARLSEDDRAWAIGLLKTSRETGVTGAAPPQRADSDEIEGIVRTAKASGIERGESLLRHLRTEHGLDMVKLSARGGFAAIERVYGPAH